MCYYYRYVYSFFKASIIYGILNLTIRDKKSVDIPPANVGEEVPLVNESIGKIGMA